MLKILKYPRTPHIQGSRIQPGDEDLSQIPFRVIAGRRLVVEEKCDGANSAVVAHAFEVIARLAKEQGLDSFRLVSNVGESAGQSVKHLHIHVLSGRDMTWPPG